MKLAITILLAPLWIPGWILGTALAEVVWRLDKWWESQ